MLRVKTEIFLTGEIISKSYLRLSLFSIFLLNKESKNPQYLYTKDFILRKFKSQYEEIYL